MNTTTSRSSSPVPPPAFCSAGFARSSWGGGISRGVFEATAPDASETAVSFSGGRRLLILVAIMMLGCTGVALFGAPQLPNDRSAEATAQLQQQQLLLLFREKVGGNNPALAEKAARDFTDRLRSASPNAAEKLKQGHMDDEEMQSRVEIFLRDHPELTGGLAVSLPKHSPRERVAAALLNFPQAAASESQRLALADRFLEKLRDRSRSAADALNSGRMADDEIQSRVAVFVADLQTANSTVAEDPKAAALSGIVEAYLKANYGLPTERAASLIIRGTVEAAGLKRDFMIFRKRPAKLRMHVVQDGLVVGVIAYDGATAWRQEAGQPARKMEGAEAAAVVQISRFDDLLTDYRERGAQVQLDDKTDKNVIRLNSREKDGSESIIEIDPKTYNTLALRTRSNGGEWVETKYSDYQKFGTFNCAQVQEETKAGKPNSITRISLVTTDPGLLDQFFALPSETTFTYMNYMGGLAMFKARQTQPSLGVLQKETAK